MFDNLGDNDPSRITSDDLVAVSLLDVSFEPRAVAALLEDPGNIYSSLLERVPVDVPLWAAPDSAVNGAASELYEALKQLDGVQRTKASKLLARKRPHLVPVRDSVVEQQLQLGVPFWGPLREALQDEGLRHRIDGLKPDWLDYPVSTLRLLDVAVWMTGSNSERARRFRDSPKEI